MKNVLATIAILILIGIAGGAGSVYSGVHNVAATAHHWEIAHDVLDRARIGSIEAHAEGIGRPSDRIRRPES